jgi:hypothetical protein
MLAFFTSHSHQATPSTIPLVNIRPPSLSPAAASAELIMISNTSCLSNTPTIDLINQIQFVPTLDTMTSFYVHNQLLFPNVDCNIEAPHFYDQAHVPLFPDHQQLMLTRFPLDQSPLPAKNCWMVVEKPKKKLWNGEEYFVMGYGVLQLHHVSETRELGQDWVVFSRAKGNIRKVIVVVPNLILFRFLVSVSALDEKILSHGTVNACIGR